MPNYLLNCDLRAAGLLAVCLTTAPLAAQFDYDLEKRTSARLGQDLVLDVVNGPATSFVLVIPSATGGPTPLALLDPVDPRALSVGVDLLSAMSVLISDGFGAATYTLPLPNNPSISGYELHWQTASLLFGATLIGELSNDVVTLTGSPDTGVLAPNSLQFARALSASLVDADNNNSGGDVLVTGGGTGTLTAAFGLASTERWDYRRMAVTPGPTMTTARALHSTVRLNDGRVLLIGGADQFGTVLSSCEIYDPTTNSFTATAGMGTPRILHGATLLADGRVMVAGGTPTLTPDVTAAITSTLSSMEIYNPTSGTWSTPQIIGGPRLAPALTLLSNGQVMISGGVWVSIIFGVPIAASSTTAVQRWNPANGSWTSGPNMSQGRAGHQYNQVTLNDGRVLMTGGINVPGLPGVNHAPTTSGAEVYDPTTNSWQTVNMPTARALHSATLLADGRVAVCGGAQGTLTAPVSIANVDVFNPTTNSWSTAPALTGSRASHTASLMPNGTLVLFGGQGVTTSLTSVETLRF